MMLLLLLQKKERKRHFFVGIFRFLFFAPKTTAQTLRPTFGGTEFQRFVSVILAKKGFKLD